MHNPMTTVSGDPTNGWLVTVHDGDNYGTYSPEAANANEAVEKGEALHAAKFQPVVSIENRLEALEADVAKLKAAQPAVKAVEPPKQAIPALPFQTPPVEQPKT